MKLLPHRSRKKNGYTLLEVLIAILIIMVLTGFGSASYRTFNRRQQVAQSVKNLQLLFRFAQKKARVIERPSGCDPLDSYAVRGDVDSALIQVYALCRDSLDEFLVTEGSLIGSTRLTTPVNIIFKVLTGGVINYGTVEVSNGSFTYQFNVNEGGDISEGGYIEQ